MEPISLKKQMARKKSCKPEQSTAPDTIPSVQKLTSQDAGERAWACIAVGQFCNDPQVCKHLLRNQVIPKLVQLLSDTAPQVVLEALGALRNFMLHNEPINEFINLQGVPAILGILQQVLLLI